MLDGQLLPKSNRRFLQKRTQTEEAEKPCEDRGTRLNFLAATGQGDTWSHEAGKIQIVLSYSHQREHTLLTFWFLDLWQPPRAGRESISVVVSLPVWGGLWWHRITKAWTPHCTGASRWEPLPPLWPTHSSWGGSRDNRAHNLSLLPRSVSHCCLPC